MKKFLLILGLLTPLALGQEVRYDYTVTTTGNPVSGSSAPAGSLVPILGVSGAGIKLCVDGACATPLVTYTDATGTTPCPSNAQLTRPPLTTCFATADPQGNFGAWMPGNTAFFYKATAVYGTFGPYPVTSPGNGAGGGTPPVVTGTSQFANNGATAFFSGGVKNTDAVGGITAAIAGFTCTTTPCQTLFVPPTSSDTTHFDGVFGASASSSFSQDARANSLGTFVVNPGLGFNDVFTGDGLPNQSAFKGVLNFTEASPAPVQGSPQRMQSWEYLNGSPGFSGLPPGCPLSCPLPPHTSGGQWASHGISNTFSSINGSGINNTFILSASSYGTGDTQLGFVGAEFLNYMGGCVAPSDECAHMLGSVHANNAGDYFATLSTIVDANHIVTSPTGNASTQGQGRFLGDITSSVIGTDSQPLVLIDTSTIQPPGVGFPYGTVTSATANFPISYAIGTLTNDCTVPVQEGGVAIGQNSGVNGCQVTVTSGTFDTAAPVCMAADRWNQFDIGIKVSVATALSGGHQTLTGTMHRSVPAGGIVAQGGLCGSLLYPEGDSSNETNGGSPIIGGVYPIFISPDAHTAGYLNYDGSQVWGGIPRAGSNWGSTDTGLTTAAHGLQAINLVRSGGVVTGLFVGVGVASTDRYLGFQQNLFFSVSGCTDSSFNTPSIGAAGFLPGPFPNASNENQANFGYVQAGPDSTCSSATIVLEHHEMSFRWGAEIYDVMNHATGAVDGTMAISYQPNFVTGHAMDSPPHYAMVSDVLNILNAMGTPGNVASALTINNFNHSAIAGSRTALGAAINVINTPTPNETKGLGGQALVSDVLDIQGYAGNWIRGDTPPGPGNAVITMGPPNAVWNGFAPIFHNIGLIHIGNVQGAVPHKLDFNYDLAEFDFKLNFNPVPFFSISPTLVNSRTPILAGEYDFGNFPFGGVGGETRFAQITPLATTSREVSYQDNYPATAVITQSGTAGSTRYDYMLFFEDQYGLERINAPYTTVMGNATLSGSNFNNIPCTDLPAGATNGQIRIFLNPVTELVGTCPNSSTVVADTGSYTDIRGSKPFIGGLPFYSGAFVASSTTGGFFFTQPDVWGTGGDALAITAGISQPSAGVVSVDTTAVGNGLGTLTAGEIIVAPSSGPSTLQMGVNLFSTLPACASGTEGTQAAVSDSTTNTWGATITGSGTNHVLGYCDGTNWTVMAK